MMLSKRSIRIMCTIAFTGIFYTQASAGHILLYGGGGDYNIEGSSWVDQKFKGVVRQRFDYSCGSAAVATLLKHHYNIDISEMEVLEDMYAVGDKEKIKKQGFSLLDIKQYLYSVGLQAEGYRESLNKLKNVNIPALALVDINSYMHFVVIKAVTDDKVLVGDPSLGLRTYNREAFEEMWNGIMFVVLTNMAQGKHNTDNIKTAWLKKEDTKNKINGHLRDADLARITYHTAYTPNYY